MKEAVVKKEVVSPFSYMPPSRRLVRMRLREPTRGGYSPKDRQGRIYVAPAASMLRPFRCICPV